MTNSRTKRNMKYYERRGSITVGTIDSSIRSSEREIPDKTDTSIFKAPGQDYIEHNQIQSPVTENDIPTGYRRILSGADEMTYDDMTRNISPAVNVKNAVFNKSNLESNQSSLSSTYDSALINWMNESSEFDGDNSSNEDESSFHNSCGQSVSSIQSITSHRLPSGSLLCLNSNRNTLSEEDFHSQQNNDSVKPDETPNIQESNKSKHNSSHLTFSATTRNKSDSQNKPFKKAVPIIHNRGNAINTSSSNGTNFISKVNANGGMENSSTPVEIENSVHDVPRDLVEVSLSRTPDELGHEATEKIQKENFHSITSYKESKNDRKARKERQVVRAEAADESYQKKVVPKSEQVKSLIYESIKSNILFTRCSREELLEIVDAFEPLQCEEGCIIIQEGDQGNHLYVMESGAIDIVVCNKYIRTLTNSGCAFGEIGLMYNTPRTATVLANKQCSLWSIHRFDYRGIIRQVNLSKAEIKSEFLKKVKLGQNILGDVLQPSEIYNVALATQTVTFNAGDMIVKEGDKGDNFFVIEHGTVDVFKEGCGENAITTLKVSDFFGEKALVYESDVRTATCIASSKTVRCLVLSRDDFKQMLGDVTGMMRKSWKLISQEIYQRREGLGIEIQSEFDKKKNLVSKAKKTEMKLTNHLGHDIEYSDLEMIRTIGVGSFGTVNLVKLRDSASSKLTNSPPLTYALKCQNKESLRKSGFLTNVQREKEIMSEIEHPFIIRMYSEMEDDENIYFLLEVLLGGELFKLLETKGNVPEDWVKFYAASVVLAFSAIHEKKIAYRDLKPENLVLDSKGYTKVIDFGLAKRVEDGKTWTLCGTPDYMAPEVILNEGHDWAVDYWALGILIFEMINGDPPFMSEKPMDVYKLILSGNLSFPSFFSTDVKDIIRKLLSPYQSMRLGRTLQGVDAVMKHKWFSNIRFSVLLKQRYHAPYIPTIKDAEDTSNFDNYGEDNHGTLNSFSYSEIDNTTAENNNTSYKISGRAIVACPKSPPLTFKSSNQSEIKEKRPQPSKLDTSIPVNVNRNSFLGRAFAAGTDFSIDNTTHTTHIGFSLSREPSLHGSNEFNSDMGDDTEFSSEDFSTESTVDSEASKNSELDEVERRLKEETFGNVAKKSIYLSSTPVPIDDCSSGDKKFCRANLPLNVEQRNILEKEDLPNDSLDQRGIATGKDEDKLQINIPVGAKLFQSFRVPAKNPIDDQTQTSQTSGSTRSKVSRWRRATAFILGASQLKKNTDDIYPITRQTSLLTLQQEMERSRTFVYKRHGKKGKINKTLFEAKISMSDRINPVVKLESLESMKTIQRKLKITNVVKKHQKNDQSHENLIIQIDKGNRDDIKTAKAEDGIFTTSNNQKKNSDYVSVTKTREMKDRPTITRSATMHRPKISDESSKMFLSSKNLVFDHRISTGDLGSSDESENQFAVFDSIVRDAKKKVKTINTALSSIGIASPFRNTEELVPRFGELHMHIKSHLCRNDVSAFSLLEKRRKLLRRNEVICRLQINECVQSFSSSFETDTMDVMTEKTHDLAKASLAEKNKRLHISHTEENSTKRDEKFPDLDQTKQISDLAGHATRDTFSNVPLRTLSDEDNDGGTKQSSVGECEAGDEIHLTREQKNDKSKQSSPRNMMDNNEDDSENEEQKSDYDDEDVQIVTLFLGKIFGFQDKVIDSTFHSGNSLLKLEQVGSEINPGDATIDRFEDLSFLANCMYYASSATNSQGKIEFLRPTSLCITSGYKFDFLMAIFAQFDNGLYNVERKEVKSDPCPKDSNDDFDQASSDILGVSYPVINLTPQELLTVQTAMHRILGDEKALDHCDKQQHERSRVASMLRELFSNATVTGEHQNVQNRIKQPQNESSHESLGDLLSLGWDDDSLDVELESVKKPNLFLTNITNALINKRGDIKKSFNSDRKEVNINYRSHKHNRQDDEDITRTLCLEQESGLTNSTGIPEIEVRVAYSQSDAIEFNVHITKAEDRIDSNGRSFTVYILEVDEVGTGVYTVEHRYSEFDRLNLALLREKVLMYSSFPQKHGIKTKDHDKIVNTRKAALNVWLIELVGHLGCGKITGQLRDRCIDFLQNSDHCMIHSESNAILRKVDGLKSSLIQFGMRNSTDTKIFTLEDMSDDNLLEDWPSL